MEFRRIEAEKRNFLPLLLLGDEQEDMIDRYLDRGVLTALYDGGLRAVCVVTAEGPGVFEIKNLAVEPAMTEEEARRAVETGIEIVHANDESTDLFAVGEMGIGNTTCSSAVLAVIAGIEPQLAVGRGAGLNPGLLGHKAQVIARAIDKHKPDKDNPIEVLAKVGGFELGGIAGVILGAAACRKPVVIDGFISTAAALIAAKLAPESVDYMIMAHASAEPGHSAMLDFLGKKPLLDLDMRLGEGSGAAVAMPILDSAAAIVNNMATFEQAKVTDEGVR